MGKKTLKQYKNYKITLLTITQWERKDWTDILFRCVKNQTWYNLIYEYLILDGTKDETKQDDMKNHINEINKKYNLPIKYYDTKGHDKKIGYLRNYSHTKINKETTHIIVQDDDDYMFPSRIEKTIKIFHSKKCDLIGTNNQYLYDYNTNMLLKFIDGKFGDNHAVNSTFAYSYEYSQNNKYDDTKTYSEEPTFLNNYKNKMYQLDTNDCIIGFSYGNNTYNKFLILLYNAIFNTYEKYTNQKTANIIKEGLTNIIPKKYIDEYMYLMSKNYPKNMNSNYDITYFTGSLLQEWDYKSKSLGGSEYAVVELSKEWVKKGYKVEVYCNNSKLEFKDYETYEGIDFYHVNKFNLQKKYNNLILWRLYGLFLLNDYFNLKANKIYVDLHDYNPENLEIIYKYNTKIDYVFLKSKFHILLSNHLNPNLKQLQHKLLSIQNGVDIDNYTKFNGKFKRDKYRLHYASSYFRGLKHILKVWSIIHNAEPRATLNCYYGMDLYPNEQERDEILELLKQPGINDFGRQPKEILAIEKQRSGWHLYPTDTIEEICCISLKESIVSGCIPILSNRNIFSSIPGIHIPWENNVSQDEFYKSVAMNVINLLNMDDNKFNQDIETLKNCDFVKSWDTISSLWLNIFNKTDIINENITKLNDNTNKNDNDNDNITENNIENNDNIKKHIRYINLDKDVNRNINFLKKINIFNYDTLKRFSAINGYDLIKDIKNKNYIYDEIFKILFDKNIDYSKGELGCILSHYFLLKEIKIDNNIQENDLIMIFEDDIIINSKINITEKINNIIEFTKKNNNWDIIYNGGRWNENFIPKCKELFEQKYKDVYLRIKNNDIINNNNNYDWDRCTFSFIINKKNIDNIINGILLYLKNNSYLPIDHILTHINNINSYDQFPHMIYSYVNSESNIQGELLNNKIKFSDLNNLIFKDNDIKIALLVLTTSNKRDNWGKLEDTYLYNNTIKTFYNTYTKKYLYEIYIGYDFDDRIFSNKNEQLKLLNKYKTKNININFIPLYNIEKGYVTKMWNILFLLAYYNKCDYFYQCGDDINFKTNDWVKDSILTLIKNNNIGLCGPLNNNVNFLTQAMFSRKHMEIFGFLFPEKIKNWFCDDWYNIIYKPNYFYPLLNHYCSNDGGSPRYNINNDINFIQNYSNNFDKLKNEVNKIAELDKKKILNYVNNNLNNNLNINMYNRNIFIYWVGKEYKLIKILRNLIYLHSKNGKGYNVILITEKNITEYIKDIPQYFNNLCPAHQADFVRVNIICVYGGIWLDSDTIVLNSLDSLFDLFNNKNGFFIKENNNILWNGIFGSKPNTPIMLEWKKNMINKLQSTKGKIGWCDIGNDMLQKIYDNNKTLYDNYEIFNGLDTMYPVNWNNCVSEFIEKPYDNYKNLIRNFQPLVVLVNSVYKKLEEKTETEILDGNIPLNYFINKSLENKGIYKNKLYSNQYIYNYGTRDYISNSIIKNKCWEPLISNIFNTIIKNNNNSDSVIMDIGCNIGYYSILNSNHSSISKIYSVDANIDNIHILNMSCLLNQIKNINPIHTCISEKSGDFYQTENKDFALKVENISRISYIKTNDLSVKNIKSSTLDDIIKKNKINDIILMKIDIDGGELNALKGLTNTLNNNIIKNIIIAISPKFNNNCIEILKILQNNNYTLYNIPHCESGIINEDPTLLKKICKIPINDINTYIKHIGDLTNILAVKTKKIVIYTDWLKKYLTKEPYMFVKNLKLYGWEIISLSKLNNEYIENIKKTRCVVLCVTYDDFDISLLKCDNIELIYKIDDIFPYKNIRNININNADIIISPYQYLFKKVYNIYKNIEFKKSFWIPYSSINNFFENIEFNDNPIQKIFISGNVDKNIYPLRYYIKNDIKFKDYIDVLEHPSYYKYRHIIINSTYYNKLNNYLCCFVDASAYNYILLKVFEICSVGSLLLVEDTIESELNKLGFFNNIHCIFCNKENILIKIKWIFNEENKNIVNKIRKNGLELVRKNHNTLNRSEQLNIIVENNIKNKYYCEYNNDKYFTSDLVQVDYINTGKAEPYSGNIDIVKNYLKLTNRNNLYIDVGVNIATHSIVFSKLFSKIIAFEADTINFNQSKENLIINNVNNVKLYNKALGNTYKKISTHQHSNHSRGCIRIIEGGDIDCITLDSMNLKNVDYIKIDVEGFELDVLKGAINTIKNNSPIIEFEYNGLSLKHYNIKYDDIDNFLNKLEYKFDKRFDDNYFYIKKTNKDIFENIYNKNIWNNGNKNIPLSGPGSSLENTNIYSKILTKFIYDNKCKSVLDLGCGDLTWIQKTQFFNDNSIKYIGVDVVESLIYSHILNFPEKKFMCKDVITYKDFENVDIIIIRDVIFHLKNDEILSIFENIKNKFKFLIITSCRNMVNTDNFNHWRFSEKNIHVEPFNKTHDFLIKIPENNFSRDALIYKHDCFYDLYSL